MNISPISAMPFTGTSRAKHSKAKNNNVEHNKADQKKLTKKQIEHQRIVKEYSKKPPSKLDMVNIANSIQELAQQVNQLVLLKGIAMEVIEPDGKTAKSKSKSKPPMGFKVTERDKHYKKIREYIKEHNGESSEISEADKTQEAETKES